jgi:uncharacterized protein
LKAHTDMAETALEILIVADDRPGHYHLAEGVAAAIGRRRPIHVSRLTINRRRLASTRMLRRLVGAPIIAPEGLLRLAYDFGTATIPQADLIISAGGDTLLANALLARARGVPNIFCGTLRHLPANEFALIISSYARHASLPRHLVCLKPNGMDPDTLGRPRESAHFGPERPPARGLLLIGGNSGLFHYETPEWRRLLDFLREVSVAWGTRWLISTSRRTPDVVADWAVSLAADRRVVEELVDYRTAGPGTLPRLLARADVALCSEDSSTMLSEAVCARLPVVGVAPVDFDFKPEEAEYRQLMLGKGWCRSIPIRDLDVTAFGAALGAITPLTGNHLDMLSGEIEARLPGLFSSRGTAG